MAIAQDKNACHPTRYTRKKWFTLLKIFVQIGLARSAASGYNNVRTWTEKAIRCNPTESALHSCKAHVLSGIAPDSRVRGERIASCERNEIRRALPIQGRQGHRYSVLKQGGTAKFSFAPAKRGRSFYICFAHSKFFQKHPISQ